MAKKEAKARIKIDLKLAAAGWRFFDDKDGPANIQLEPNVKLTPDRLNALGEDFEKHKSGFVDYLLLDEKGYPLIVLEAKSEDKNPLVGKEQARKYARSLNCRFVLLSNGNVHYFWDLERGNPHIITDFPRPESVKGYSAYTPDPRGLVEEQVEADYIVLTQMPTYRTQAGWLSEAERPIFMRANRLRFLRDYQLRAIRSIQRAVKEGKERFLFEMATGTGKTLTSAAVIKLFLRTGNARRVLFLVDRLELEDQANKAFQGVLRNDYKSVIYKESREDWRSAEIVVTTVQSLLFDNKYRRLFSPTDFDLVISDEAHRSIGGNSRAVFDYFVGYKLGLTATPRDYLKKIEKSGATLDPREYERRVLLDTYKTFGCEDGEPTFRYSLLDGVKDGYLINPFVVDARTDVTAQLLSDEGYAAMVLGEDGQEAEQRFGQRDFEKRFFSEATNRVFCRTFLNNALADPISGELGKSIVFAVSQNHATKLVQILNEEAERMFPGRYKSDFAVQVTSNVMDAQQMTINFTNNNLLGSGNFREGYRTSKARVCVTVGMMTTGYDCPDLLNLALMRPVFSPTDFVQIKGRGTRRHDFTEQITDPALRTSYPAVQKHRFKLFDFFANCEYFETQYNYDEILKLPTPRPESKGGGAPPEPVIYDEFERTDPDKLKTLKETQIGPDGMKVDRMLYQRFEERVRDDATLRELVLSEQWDKVVDYVNTEVMNRPDDFFTLDGLRRSAGVDRRLSMREIIEKALGRIPRFKTRDELLDEEFDKFLAHFPPGERDTTTTAHINALRYYFKAYATNPGLRMIIDGGRLGDLNTNAAFTMQDFKQVPADYRKRVPEYIKDNLPLNQFME